MTSKDYDEELKIDIANAMSKGELGIQGRITKRLNMKTIKIILLLFCIILGINAKAQTVGYTYKALAAEGLQYEIQCG